MTKFLIIFVILLVVAALVAMRYRQQIKMAIYVWRMFRKMRQIGKADERQIEKQEPAAKDVALVRCAKCGTWIPNNKAINLRSGANYCSTACLETAVSAS